MAMHPETSHYSWLSPTQSNKNNCSKYQPNGSRGGFALKLYKCYSDCKYFSVFISLSRRFHSINNENTHTHSSSLKRFFYENLPKTTWYVLWIMFFFIPVKCIRRNEKIKHSIWWWWKVNLFINIMVNQIIFIQLIQNRLTGNARNK